MGEEDRSRAVPAPQAILFAEMWKEAADDRVSTCLARRPCVFEPVDAAIARTGAAIGQRCDGGLRAGETRS
jgi:hypothetical protein